MLKEEKRPQYGKQGLDVKGIVIHNTNNYTKNIDELMNYLENESKTSNGTHFLVDDKKIIEVMPLDWCVWSTGKGNDWCFRHCISIEIVSNINDELYLSGQKRAIKLIKRLMKKYSLTKEDIYFHNDFNKEFYCPATILRIYGNKENFLKELGG